MYVLNCDAKDCGIQLQGQNVDLLPDHLIRCEPTATGGLATLGSTQESAHGKP